MASKKTAAQVAPARSAAALKAASKAKNNRPPQDEARREPELIAPSATPIHSLPRQPRAPPPLGNLLLDKRAAQIAATMEGDDDQMFTTPQLAALFATSTQFLEILRHEGGGPPFARLGPRCIRYRRGTVREWLIKRATHHCTKEYSGAK